jgi:hypothetical protein
VTEPPKETQAPVTGAPETKAPATTAPVTSAPETGETAAPGGSGVPVYAVAILIASLCGCVISALLFFRSPATQQNRPDEDRNAGFRDPVCRPSPGLAPL